MENDRIFAVYALTLIGAVASLITAMVVAGVATPPSGGVFLEHVALGLSIRTAYKSFAGLDWFYALARVAGFITAEEAAPEAAVSAARV